MCLRQFKRRPDWAARMPVHRSKGSSRAVFVQFGKDVREDFAAAEDQISSEKNGSPIPLGRRMDWRHGPAGISVGSIRVG